MARNDARPIIPSVYDRLLGAQLTEGSTRGQLLRDLKQSVRRDLENLLNTRCRFSDPDLLKKDRNSELRKSLVAYGIPDFTGAVMSRNEAKRALREIVEETLEIFEPRFVSVKVTVDDSSKSDRSLNLRIDATLYAEPAPEPVVFESRMELATSEVEVKTAE